MNLAGVIEELIEERGLDKEQVAKIICDGVQAAYEKKFPDLLFHTSIDSRNLGVDVEVEKEVVSSSPSVETEITLRRARVINPKVEVGNKLFCPFDGQIGRVELLVAKQLIAQGIRDVEQAAVFKEFHEREGSLITGTIHKRERAGYAVNLGDVVAFLPNSCAIPEENLRVGFHVRALLKEVLESTQGGYQLILDRASPEFVKKLLETEIPEIFEGIVEIKEVSRVACYKTKIAVVSNSSDVDPVGTCVGVGGSRIKPILKEIGSEKVDLIVWTDNLETFVRGCLKPAEIERVRIGEDGAAMVWLPDDQRSFAIGKMGQNIFLASKLAGVDIHLQEPQGGDKDELFAGGDDVASDDK